MMTTTYSSLLSKSYALREEMVREGEFLSGDRCASADLDSRPTRQDRQDDRDLQHLCPCHGYVLPTGVSVCEW